MSRAFPKINPATGTLIREYPAAGPEEIHRAVQSAREAEEVYGQTSLSQRGRLLRRIADRLYAEREKLAEVICEETGKPKSDALEADLGPAMALLAFYAGRGPEILKPQSIRPDHVSLVTMRRHQEVCRPRGVIAIISPWNYPLGIPAGGLAAALMAGNACVLKPSELTPATGVLLVDLIRQVLKQEGLPEETVQVLVGDGITGAGLLQEDIDGVIFTGSGPTGQKVAVAMAGRGLWSSLELGGSDPMIVLPECSPEVVASYAVWGRFANAGQACAAVKRLIVPQGQLEAILGLLKTKMALLKVGPPQLPGAHVGPLISEAQRNLLDSQVQDALGRGARLLIGGKPLDGQGWFYEPTLLADVPIDARILNEEVFGPVLPVIPYQSLDEAVALANRTAFGLSASVFGPAGMARQVADRLHCGTVVINDVGTSNFAMACAPWGGWKGSGSGASHGERALRELSRVQIISTNGLFVMPGLGKPLWQFSREGVRPDTRTRAILDVTGKRPAILHPRTWFAFWQHRASTKL